jgi:hypothetical protein
MMVGLIWIIWLFNQILILVILMNFLIAIIAQSFEEMMSRKTINKYSQRAEMNKECRLNLFSFGLAPKVECITIQADNSVNESNEWQGFVHAIKKTLKFEMSLLKDKLNNMSSHQTDFKNTIEKRLESMETRIEKNNEA